MPKPNRGNRVNQRQLAERLNLSIATVSRSLKGHPDIAPETRRRILQEANLLGYQGRESIAQGNCIVALISATVSEASASPVTEEFLRGISAEAQASDILLVTHYLPDAPTCDTLPSEQQPIALRNGMANAVLLIHLFSNTLVQELARRFPIVSLAHYYPQAPCDFIDSDHIDGMETIVAHLVGLGHRELLFVSSLAGGVPNTRLASAFRAANLHGAKLDPTRTVHFNISIPAAQRRAALSPTELISQQQGTARLVEAVRAGMSGLICDCDTTAFYVIQQLTEAGLQVPRDVSVTGFDGVYQFPNCPTITTYAVPFAAMGRRAVKEAIGRFGKTDQNHRLRIMLGGHLIEGQTASAPHTSSH